MREKAPSSDWDARRFRPNFVLETHAELRGLVEASWEGRVLRIGELRLQCTVAAPRCSMVMQEQPGRCKDSGVLRTIVREANQCLGMYASVLQPGRITVGAAAVLE